MAAMMESAAIKSLDEEVRRTILDATMLLLDELEPEQISISMVVKASGLPVNIVRSHYSHGVDILRELAQELMDRVDDPLVELLDASLPIGELAARALELLAVTNSLAERRLLRIMRFSRDLMVIEQQSIERIVTTLSSTLQQRNPKLAEVPARAGAHVLIRSVLSGAGLIVQEADPELRGGLVRETCRAATVYAEDLIGRDG